MKLAYIVRYGRRKPARPPSLQSCIARLTLATVASFSLTLLLCPFLRAQEPNKPDAPIPLKETQPFSPDALATNSQDAKPSSQEPADNQKKNDEDKKNGQEGKQTKRIFGVVPNFGAVDADTTPPPLTTKGKFKLATAGSIDYSAFLGAGVIAGQSMALRSYPELGHGMAGYGRYYWRAFADQASETYFTTAIVPSLTHEDPRYYTLGHGGFFHRMGYAMSRVVITKTDSGGTSFNYSEIVGSACEAGLSNAYYPSQERSWRNTGLNYASQIEGAVVSNIFREFWPDIHKKFAHKK